VEIWVKIKHLRKGIKNKNKEKNIYLGKNNLMTKLLNYYNDH